MKVQLTTIKKTRLLLNGQDIINAIRGIEMPSDARNIKVLILIPGGGDYSNMSLPIDVNCPIEITFETEENQYEDNS